MSIHTLEQQGLESYKRADYPKALGLLTRAASRLPSVQSLDKCAACHEKLGNVQAALQHAKKTIQLAQEDPTGYLRAGKILAKMGKTTSEFELYSRGLRAVKHVGKGYDAMRQRHGELLLQISPPRAVDPFTLLPRELALCVLSYLTFRQRTYICRVSKNWDRFIRSDPGLWKHVDLTGARKKVKASFVSKCINTARAKLAAATLNRVYDFDKVLSALVRTCPIEKLTLLETGLQAINLVGHLKSATKLRELKIGSGTTVTTDTILAIMHSCSGMLQVLEIEQVVPCVVYMRHEPLQNSQLRVLNLKTSGVVLDMSEYEQIFTTFPLLESLTFTHDSLSKQSRLKRINIESAIHLTHLDLTTPAQYNIASVRLPKSLRTLRLHIMCSTSHFLSLDGSGEYQLDLPNLEVVDFRMIMAPMEAVLTWLGITNYPDVELDIAAGDSAVESSYVPPSKLKSLSMTNATSDSSLPDWSNSRLSELEHLALRSPIQNSRDILGDTELEAVADLCHLQSLDLSETAITGAGVKKIVKAGNVKQLILNGCQNVGRDAIDWARSEGIKVEHKMAQESGKRVRYG